MNKKLLERTGLELLKQLERCKQQTVHLDERLEYVMAALAAMCAAIADKDPDLIK